MRAMFNATQSIILASASPRRQRFLARLGLDYQCIPADIDEKAYPNETPESFVQRMAVAKARRIAEQHPFACVIGADTVVCLGARIFGKPANTIQALSMLQHLRGRTHQVITGLAILCKEKNIEDTSICSSSVRFAFFPDHVLQAYIDTGEPMDKAGAYAIQGKGSFLIRSIEGSWTNVVGLPMDKLLHALLKHGLISSFDETLAKDFYTALY